MPSPRTLLLPPPRGCPQGDQVWCPPSLPVRGQAGFPPATRSQQSWTWVTFLQPPASIRADSNVTRAFSIRVQSLTFWQLQPPFSSTLSPNFLGGDLPQAICASWGSSCTDALVLSSCGPRRRGPASTLHSAGAQMATPQLLGTSLTPFDEDRGGLHIVRATWESRQKARAQGLHVPISPFCTPIVTRLTLQAGAGPSSGSTLHS